MQMYGSVVGCSELSDKELHRYTGRCGYGTLVRNVRDVDLIPTLGTIFPIFVTPMTLVAMTLILYMLHAAWLLKLLCVSVYGRPLPLCM